MVLIVIDSIIIPVILIPVIIIVIVIIPVVVIIRGFRRTDRWFVRIVRGVAARRLAARRLVRLIRGLGRGFRRIDRWFVGVIRRLAARRLVRLIRGLGRGVRRTDRWFVGVIRRLAVWRRVRPGGRDRFRTRFFSNKVQLSQVPPVFCRRRLLFFKIHLVSAVNRLGIALYPVPGTWGSRQL
jgi:hypothetical protein